MDLCDLWDGKPKILAILKTAHDRITPEQFIALNRELQRVISKYNVIQADCVLVPIDDEMQENSKREESLRTVLESAKIIYGEKENNQPITLGTEVITYRVKLIEETGSSQNCFYGQCSVRKIQYTRWGKFIQPDLLLGRNVGDVIPVTLDIGDANLEIIRIQ